MSYDEIKYWRDRLKNNPHVNTSANSIHPVEEELIKKYIGDKQVILDHGVGDGRMFPLWCELNLSVQGWDIADFSDGITEQLKKYHFHYYHFVSEKPDEIFPYVDNNFDAVVSFSVLTHCHPEKVLNTFKEITRIGKIVILSAYDDAPLPITEETYCFLHDYNSMIKELDLVVLETQKVNKMRFFVVKKKNDD